MRCAGTPRCSPPGHIQPVRHHRTAGDPATTRRCSSRTRSRPSTEYRSLTSAGCFADPHHGESFARIVIAEFPSGSASVAALPAAESAKLAIAKTFMSTVGVEADVIGHADQPGTAAGKSRISQARAANVKADLEGRRIATARFITVRGVGSAECAAAGPQPSCRKVELFMYIMRGASVTHP